MAANPPPNSKRIAVEIPKDLEAAYANGTLITHTQSEVVLDFIQILPRVSKGKVVGRIIMSPIQAKRLQEILTQSVVNFERQFGEIKLPPSLADQLFRMPPGDDDGNGDES